MSKIRIVLADDHQAMLENVRELLSTHFDVVSSVTNGQEALDAALLLRPDIAVLDIAMPVMNGIEAARLLQAADPSIGIVFITADRDAAVCRAALDTGAQGYVIKARMASDLIAAVRMASQRQQFVSPGCGAD